MSSDPARDRLARMIDRSSTNGETQDLIDCVGALEDVLDACDRMMGPESICRVVTHKLTGGQPPVPVASLVGVDPDWTDGACSVCFVRIQRRDPDGVVHAECRHALGLDDSAAESDAQPATLPDMPAGPGEPASGYSSAARLRAWIEEEGVEDIAEEMERLRKEHIEDGERARRNVTRLSKELAEAQAQRGRWEARAKAVEDTRMDEIAALRQRYGQLMRAFAAEHRINLERDEWGTRAIERHVDALRTRWDLDAESHTPGQVPPLLGGGTT